MNPLVEGEGFDVVLSEAAGLGLQSGGDVGLQLTLLTLDRSNFHLQTIGVMASEGGQEEVSNLGKLEAFSLSFSFSLSVCVSFSDY